MMWKENIKQNRALNRTYQPDQHIHLYVNKIRKSLLDVHTKDLYWHYIDKISQRPSSEIKWATNSSLNISPEIWKIIYTADKTLTRDSKIQSFQFKVTHRILACGYNLAI